MSNKILFLIFLFFILFIPPLRAQSPGGGYYEERYVQQLVWIGDQYTLKYEVVLERNEDGRYKTYLVEFTETPSIQVSLPSGKYRYRVIPYDYLENPGEASGWETIEVKPASAAIAEKKPIPINLYFGASWTPLFPLSGRMKEVFENNFYIAGASLRFGALYSKPKFFYPGIEFSASYYDLKNAQSADTIAVKTGLAGINIVAQKPLFKRMAVTLKAGASVLFQVSEITVEDYSFWTGGMAPQINAEASFSLFATKKMYLEAGVGYNHILNKDGSSGVIRPFIGLGWKF